jgi:7,8-dihydroneopterin aldolase/epimerase/oxygenase
MAQLKIKGLRYLAPHGVYPREHVTGNLFEVDIVLEYDTTAAAASDDVSQSIDYGKLAGISGSVMNGSRVNLIETLASKIGGRILRDFGTIETLTVSIRKYHPDIGAPVGYAEITQSWKRP